MSDISVVNCEAGFLFR